MIDVVATTDCMSFNRVDLTRGGTLETFSRVLGPPSESYGASGSVYTRDNQLHMYHSEGLYLVEHHATYLITYVGIVLEPEHAHFETKIPFSGSMNIAGVNIVRGMRDIDFVEQANTSFERHLGCVWFAKGPIIIDIVTYPLRTRSGAKSRKRAISQVCLTFDYLQI